MGYIFSKVELDRTIWRILPYFQQNLVFLALFCIIGYFLSIFSPTGLPVLQGCGVNWVSILFSNLGPKDGLRVFSKVAEDKNV